MSDRKLSRRAFTGMLALGAAPLAGLSVAQEAAKQPDTATKPKQDEAPATKPLSREELYLEIVKQTYPEGLEAEHLDAIRQEIRGNLLRSQILSEHPLTNGDGPATVFRAYRAAKAPA